MFRVTTVIVWSALTELPVASVAVHVLVITSMMFPVPGTDTSLNVTVGAGSALSVAVAKPVLAGVVSAGNSNVTSAGTVRTGSVVSCIM
ncbi:hypothetical protein C5F49_06595 [Nitrosopumilus oxyclinae]|uniref:Uncharacterized protein n=1 Tax=Nitrosopumilus oxyclinae TaxID=1959104 RepID=A0A7D5RB51_9ARCH|nr:hypothetical protein [Nitrosopumilus oxyclinae]QLH05021.1 hypothetical protein C5F49_06595 [Nitrosopumilus oxyclinae]